jgi:hypothetical protein
MTEAQAHKFIERWERIAFPQRWRAKTEIQSIRRLESLFLGLGCGAIGVILTSFGDFIGELFGVTLLIFSLILFLRSRKACQVLDQSQITNPKL